MWHMTYSCLPLDHVFIFRNSIYLRVMKEIYRKKRYERKNQMKNDILANGTAIEYVCYSCFYWMDSNVESQIVFTTQVVLLSVKKAS